MRIAVGIVVALIAGCAEADSCLRTDDAKFDAAVQRELAANNVKYRLDDERGICVPKDASAALEATYQRVNRYRFEVAALLSDECEQRHLVEWAKRENIPFDVAPTTK